MTMALHPLIRKYLKGEIVVSQGPEAKALSKVISAAVKVGTLKKVAPTIYTTAVAASTEDVVRRNAYAVIGALYPTAIVSHRSAMEGGIKDHNVVLTFKYTKKIKLQGLTVHLIQGKNALADDMPFVGSLFMSSPERSWLENCEISSGSDFKKVLPRDLFENDLENYLAHHGEEKFKKRIDRVHEIAKELDMHNAAEKFQKIAGALLGTRSTSHLTSEVAIARASGLPFDQERQQLFQTLYVRLKDATQPGINPIYLGKKNSDFINNLCFYDAYFSNYIEGTRFELGEAEKIVFLNEIPKHRPDGHDVRGTFIALYGIATGKYEAFETSGDFVEWICAVHRDIMGHHLSKLPSEFKSTMNMAGNTKFVAPELVQGTLHKAFEYYPSLPDGYPKALFLKFLISEIHPFTDGNGRLSRIVLNRELYRAGYWPIIIPTVFRNEYLDALRKLTRSKDPEVYIKAMRKAASFTSQIDFSEIGKARSMLEHANAFSEERDDVLLSVITRDTKL